MNIAKISGKRIKSIREQVGLSQSNVATFLGVDQSYVSKIESDQRTITVDLLEKLASLFGVKRNAFMEESTDEPLAYAFRATEITGEDMSTICAINKIALNCKFLEELLSGEE
jgi:transcriptional regulator with XRE-family HTH domain